MPAPYATSLRGRETELSRLLSALDDAAVGSAQFILIESSAGLGKTRLLRELMLAAASKGFAVLHAECQPERRHVPFSGVMTAFGALGSSPDPARRRLAAKLAGVSEALPEQRYLAANTVVGHLEEILRIAPVLLVLDDFHEADSGSRLVLRQASAELGDGRVVIVVAQRPHEADHETRLNLDAVRLDLQPLSPVASTAVVEELIGARTDQRLRRVIDACGGSPLLLVEMVKQLRWEGAISSSGGVATLEPETGLTAAGAILARRVESLPRSATELLSLASVLGRSFTVSDLAALTKRSPAELVPDLQVALTAGLLLEGNDTLAFAHALLHDAAYRRLAAPLRTEMHREAARLYERRGAPPARIARHLVEIAGERDPMVIDTLVEAGRELMGRAPEEAVELLQRAQTHMKPGHAARAQVSALLAEALSWSGQLVEAESAAGAALSGGLDRDTEATLRVHLTRTLRLQGRAGDAFTQAMSAGGGPRELLAEAALAAVFCHRVDHARELASGLLRESDSDLAACIALCASCFGSFLSCHWHEAVQAGAQAVRLGESNPAFMAAAQPRLYYGHVLTVTGRLEEGERQLQTGLREAEREGRRWLEPSYHQYLARKRWLAGEWEDAIAEDEAAISAAEDIARGNSRLMAGPLLSMSVRLHRGDIDRATLDTMLAGVGTSESPTGGSLSDWQLGLALEAAGRPSQALEVLVPLWRRNAEGGVYAELRQAGADLVRIAIAAGRKDEVAFAIALLEELRRRARHPLAEAGYLHALALWNGSLDLCLKAIELLRSASRPLELATAYEAAANLASDAEAIALARSAEEVYASLGATVDVARVRNRMRRLGVRTGARGPRRRAAIGWQSLSESETRVAALVAEGLSNPEVAERLYLSRRTIETHLKHIYQKLVIRSRVQLATIAATRRGG